MKPAAMAKAVVVHDLDQAAMALAVAASLKEPVAIWSAPRAAFELGVGWFAALVRRARESEPRACSVFVLDCGDRADLVQDSFREGLGDACFTGRAPSISLPSGTPRARSKHSWAAIEMSGRLGY